jgi:F0F1-type ATP synthase assembly protein I
MNEPLTALPRAALLAIMMAGRYRPGRHRHQNGFLHHAFATSPWLGAIVVALIVLVGLVLALIKQAGRVLEGTPWYVRVALLVTAGFGIFRLLSRREQATPQGSWHPPDGSQPDPYCSRG